MKNYVSQNELILFTQNMTSLLKSGLSLQESLDVCEKINSKKENILLCKFLNKKINEGETLSSSLKSFGNKISSFYIALIEIGEAVGSLVDVFEKLSEYLKEKKKIKSKIIQALIYPLIVILTAFFVITVIVFFVFPKLENIFEVFTESSEVVALKIDRIKNALTMFCVISVLMLLIIIAIIVMKKINKKFSFCFDKVLLYIPLVKKYFITSCTNDFSYAMKILCMSSISFSESLIKASEVIKNQYYKRCIKNVYKKVVAGENIGIAFSQEKILPQYLVTWILLAQTTGNIDGVFIQISEYFKNEFINMIQQFIVSVEPIFILITGILIFILIGQFVLPIFSLLGAL